MDMIPEQSGVPPVTAEEWEFLELSQALTGFTTAELATTGQTAEYCATVLRRLGQAPYRRLLAALAAAGGEPDGLPEGPEREAARAVCGLWYLGVWPGLRGDPSAPSVAVSGEAYAAGLIWRTFGTRAPGTARPGYGSWGAEPEEE
ncbi:hypothetical protein CFP65_5985 [Kitasatospora sp. MMS16-BH015]|uniref:hypothetical protein n=1 Tax=Kitasatospora sp. MMS16-BH015 TaxID=2018025 RepID=UPI000CA33D4D|nr:hypothetical protein [Kitasatospora sp. MMS16-BH015]AUG80659.1 hypothetical protein CFP65_5985 [Kitasatospora sp. MMS16-BH015]